MSFSKRFVGEEPMRLNKWMAELGLCSRREAEALIARGSVTVNGVEVKEAGHKVSQGDVLELTEAGQDVLDDQITVVIHKPVGYVSAQPESDQVPAARLLKRARMVGMAERMPDAKTSLAPLGRLDMDSRGLLILSEDGVLAKAVIGPGSPVDKEYLVTVSGPITEDKLRLLRHGLELDGKRLRPARVVRVEGQVLRFTLAEGRNRQIRRMCELVDLRVIDLLRIRIGPLKLAGLKEGEWRMLGEDERLALIEASKAEPPAWTRVKSAPMKRMKKPQPKPAEEARGSWSGREGDRPRRDGPGKPRGGFDRKPRSEGDGGSRGPRPDGDRPKRAGGGRDGGMAGGERRDGGKPGFKPRGGKPGGRPGAGGGRSGPGGGRGPGKGPRKPSGPRGPKKP